MPQVAESAKRAERGTVSRTRLRGYAIALLTCVFCVVAVASAAAASGAHPTAMIYVDDLGSTAVTPVNIATGVALPAITIAGLLPVALALTPNGRQLYIVEVGSDEDGSPGSVVTVDTASDAVVHRIPVGPAPQAIAVASDGRIAYVLGGNDAATTPSTRPVTLTPIEVASDTAQTPIAVGTLPDAMVLSPSGGELYVLDTSPTHPGSPTEITPVDLRSGAAGSPIHVAAVHVVFTPDGATAYAITSPPALVPIDVAHATVGHAIALGNALALDAAVTPDGKTLEVLGTPDPGLEQDSPEGDNWTLTPIDVATGRAGTPVKLGAHPASSTGSVTVAPGGESADVLIDGSASAAGVVVPVNLARSSAGAPIAVGREASALVFAPGGATAYVLDSASSGVVVPISSASGRAGPAIAVGRSPLSFALAAIPESPAPMTAAGTGAAVAENRVATAAVKAQLVEVFAAARGLRGSEVGGTYKGSVFYSYDTATRTYWAAASFDPAAGDSQRIDDSFQDAGSNGLFSRPAGGSWRFRGAGAPLSCLEDRVVPAAVARLWGVPPHVAGCASG